MLFKVENVLIALCHSWIHKWFHSSVSSSKKREVTALASFLLVFFLSLIVFHSKIVIFCIQCINSLLTIV